MRLILCPTAAAEDMIWSIFYYIGHEITWQIAAHSFANKTDTTVGESFWKYLSS